MIDDWRIFALARAGDEKAWREIFRRHYPALVRITSSMAGSLEAGHDIAQESFVRLLGARIEHHEGTLRSLLATIAYRLAVKEARRLRLYDRTETARVTDETPSPLEQLVKEDTDRILARVVQRLPLDQREVLTLRFFGECSYVEIAHITGVPVGTVKSRIFYAVKTCRDKLKERGVST